MDVTTRDLVPLRDGERCEYCRLHQQYSKLIHHVEHIQARQHGGTDDPDNLALACHRCNLYKGLSLTGIDPHTSRVVPLFHPRRDRWSEHFVFAGARIEGISASGRATVRVFAMNDILRLELRLEVLKQGELPSPYASLASRADQGRSWPISRLCPAM